MQDKGRSIFKVTFCIGTVGQRAVTVLAPIFLATPEPDLDMEWDEEGGSRWGGEGEEVGVGREDDEDDMVGVGEEGEEVGVGRMDDAGATASEHQSVTPTHQHCASSSPTSSSLSPSAFVLLF